MNIKPIKTEQDYEAALAEVARLFEAEPETADSDYVEILLTLIEAYEESHYAIPTPDPVEAILYYMESRGLTPAEMVPYIGSQTEVTEVLNRHQPLSLPMIQRLYAGLGIPAEALIQPYETVAV